MLEMAMAMTRKMLLGFWRPMGILNPNSKGKNELYRLVALKMCILLPNPYSSRWEKRNCKRLLILYLCSGKVGFVLQSELPWFLVVVWVLSNSKMRKKRKEWADNVSFKNDESATSRVKTKSVLFQDSVPNSGLAVSP
ncbi:uncharacterized protein LOC128289170 [Gossypium arboreum]|uniref:uncharacterized protein LOC128286896 n=1 Tax=Gossypium arboreum TaxID=29729 RepID=UPI0022F1641E|nr:uncharacterized protein LOC128286896 [Gossypium arboreum]XP_052880975.1 uncharacterized protein LOC128289170 [Gossypium arboreum]